MGWLRSGVLGICLWATLSTGAPVLATEGAPVVLFDQAHGQRFLVDGEGPLQLTALGELFRGEGLKVRTGNQAFSDEALSDVDALVISGPFQSFSSGEIEAVTRFLERGGRLCVMLHIGAPAHDLLHRLGVKVSNGVLRESEGVVGDRALDFYVTRFASHPLTGGLTRFSLFGGWALLNTDHRAEVIARTGSRAWIDLNRDGRLSGQDAVQSFGVLVAGRQGAGEFAVFGDDAIFQNQFLDEDNRVLAKNLALWLKGVR